MSMVSSGGLTHLQSVPREVSRWQKAQQQLMTGRFSHALGGYRELVKTYQSIPQLWFELGVAATGDLEFKLADDAFQNAIRFGANDCSLLLLIGGQYQKLRKLDRARKCYELAVKADSGSSHAQLTLAAWLERERNLDAAENCVLECLKREPRNASAIYYRAFLEHRRGQTSEAITHLQDLIRSGIGDQNIRQSSRHLLGMVMDEAGNHAEALRWLTEAKTMQRQMGDAKILEAAYDRTARQRRELVNSLKAEDIQRWKNEASLNTSPYRLAFLGGHPRSGTTLIEQILGAHPMIAAFDEPEAFNQEVVNEIAQASHGLTMDRLNSISASSRTRIRERYFKSLLRELDGEPGERILLDKNPSPTASLHLWLRLFPELKVIIPLRDPRDVVVSSYFQNFTLTATNVNFLSIERTARHYSDLMDVWLRLRDLGGFDWIETRYEDVVSNPETEGRRITQFLGLDWQAKQAESHETAKRKFVFSPTYNDVTKPVHKRAVGRWNNYAEALAPQMEQLAPYVKVFGY